VAVKAALLIVCLAAGATRSPWAQTGRKSQHGTLTQRVADAEVRIVYNRPVARGRELFGGIVPYGKEWDPGADEATTIAFSTDVLFGGARLPAGTYSVWVVPMERGPWTFILSVAADVFHTPYPKGNDALRIPVTPQRGSHMETLAFYFPVVDADSAVLSLHWGTTVLPIPIKAGGAPR
jgi:DUF2911 family protein